MPCGGCASCVRAGNIRPDTATPAPVDRSRAGGCRARRSTGRGPLRLRRPNCPRREVGERGDTPWRHREAGDYWLSELHGFAWLRDLNAAGTGQAAERGRAMVLDWLRQHRTIESAAVSAWGPETLGRRLTAWFAHSAFLLQGADDEFARRFHQALELQASHLTRTARNADEGLPQLIAFRGSIESGLCLRRVSGASRKASSSSKRRWRGTQQATAINSAGTRRRTSRRYGASRAAGDLSTRAGTRRHKRSLRGSAASRRHCACSATATAGSPCSTAASRRSGA